MPTEVDSLFIKFGAIADEFYKIYNRVEKKVDDAAKKLAINVNVDPKNLRSLEKELDRLKARAQELRGNMLTLKPTVQNPNVIKDLEHELKKVEDRMRLVSAAADDLRERGKRLGEIGDKVSGVGRSITMGLTLPAIAAGTALFMLADRTGAYAEQLSNLSESSGLSTRTLQEMKYIADNAGMSFEGITTAAGMVQQKLMGVEEDSGMAAKAFERLGINVHDTNGNLKSMDVLFPQLISKLQGMENQTERNMLAAQIFGRGWRDLAPILGMTSDEMDAARKKAEELGVVMSDEALKAAQELDDAIDELKQQFVGMGRDLAKELIPILKNDLIPMLREHGIPLFKELLKVGLDVLKWFSNLSPETQKFVLSLTAISIAAGPILSFFGNLLKVAGSLWSILSKVAGAIQLISKIGIVAAAAPYVAAIGAGVAIPYFGSGVGPAKKQAAQKEREVAEMNRRLTATGMPNYRDIAGEMGLSQAYEAGTLTSQQKQKLLSEFRRRQAAWSQSRKAVPAMAGIPQMANTDDIQAAEDVLYDIKHRNAGELEKLRMEREKSLKDSKGPQHTKAIMADYDDKERALREKQAKEQKELQDKRLKEEKAAYEKALQAAEEKRRRLAAILEAETQAYESAMATQLAIAGKTYEAEMQQAVNTYMKGWRELDRIAKEEGGPESIYYRWVALVSEYEKTKLDIEKRYSDESARLKAEADKKQLEAARSNAESNVTMWEKAASYLQDYSDRLVKFLYGETAMRIQQLDRWRDAEKKAIEESISDAEMRAGLLEALDSDYALRRDEIEQDEKKAQDNQLAFLDRLRQMTGFNSAEGAWRRAVESGAQLAFSTPNLNPQMSMPRTATALPYGMGISQVVQLLQYANQKSDESVKVLKDVKSQLEVY